MATAVDTIVPVKQHGFIVREGPKDYPQSPVNNAADHHAASTAVEEPIESGLSRKALGLLDTPVKQAHAPLTGGLPCSGDIRPAEHAHLSSGVKRLMRSVMRGLKAHQEPEAATEGLGGTYFFRNEAGSKIAIMKPCDEEPLAPNNPKGFVGRQLGDPGLKPTVRVGEAASREVAAYLLDHDRFARVPHTVMVNMSHPIFHRANSSPSSVSVPSVEDNEDSNEATPADYHQEEANDASKQGSLQEFVPHECDTSELGASCFSVKDVQRIGIMDIRLFNTDRHAGNILVRRTRGAGACHASIPRFDAPAALADLYLQEHYELIPIDHGFALPEALEPPYFEWQHWPQAMMPFGKEELEYIARLDPAADAELLRRELPTIREESLRLLQVSTTVLQKCAAAGLSLSEIAGIVTRPLIGLDEEPSELEKICFAARSEVEAAMEEEEDSDDESDGDLSDLDEDDDEHADEHVAVVPNNDKQDDVSTPTSDSSESHFTSGDNTTNPITTATTTKSLDMSRAGTLATDEALFSMDEDGNALRTPINGSPAATGITAFTPTPGDVGMASYRYYGSTDRMGSDSLPGSYSSGDTASHGAMTVGGRMGSMVSSASTFGGSNSAAFKGMPATYVAGAHMMHRPPRASTVAPGNAAAKSQPRGDGKGRRRRAGHGRSRLRKLVARAYPPLVEARAFTGAESAVFSDMTDAQFEYFLRLVSARIDAGLMSGCWEQAAQGKGAVPQMSCPRF